MEQSLADPSRKHTKKQRLGRVGMIRDYTGLQHWVREIRVLGDTHTFPSCTHHPEYHIYLAHQC